MTVKDLSALKEIVEWARSQKITRLKLGETEIDISPLSYIDQPPSMEFPEMSSGLSKSWVDTLESDKKQEEDDLYFSAR